MTTPTTRQGLSLDDAVSQAVETRKEELFLGLGGPMLDCKTFLENPNIPHHVRMQFVEKLAEIGRDPMALVTGGISRNGMQPQQTMGAQPATVQDQLLALANAHPDNTQFLVDVMNHLAQLPPGLARGTAAVASAVARGESDSWEVVPIPGTRDFTLKVIADQQQTITAREAEIAALKQRVATLEQQIQANSGVTQLTAEDLHRQFTELATSAVRRSQTRVASIPSSRGDGTTQRQAALAELDLLHDYFNNLSAPTVQQPAQVVTPPPQQQRRQPGNRQPRTP